MPHLGLSVGETLDKLLQCHLISLPSISRQFSQWIYPRVGPQEFCSPALMAKKISGGRLAGTARRKDQRLSSDDLVRYIATQHGAEAIVSGRLLGISGLAKAGRCRFRQGEERALR
jgi:hypothetical protein